MKKCFMQVKPIQELTDVALNYIDHDYVGDIIDVFTESTVMYKFDGYDTMYVSKLKSGKYGQVSIFDDIWVHKEVELDELDLIDPDYMKEFSMVDRQEVYDLLKL